MKAMKALKISATAMFFLAGIGFLVSTKLFDHPTVFAYVVTIGAGLFFIGAGVATTREMLKGNFR